MVNEDKEAVMTTDECMEYAQKLCDAQTPADRSAARKELRAAIDAAAAGAAEQRAKRCAKVCDDLAAKMEKRNEPGWSVAAVCAMDILAICA